MPTRRHSPPTELAVVRAGVGQREALAAAFAVAGEAVVVLLAFSADVPMPTTLGLHVAVVAVVAAILFLNAKPSRDRSISTVMLLVIAVAGPAGAAAALAMLPFVDNAGAGPEVLQKWYVRLANAAGTDPATKMHDRVTAGRVMRFDDEMPHDFAGVIATGNLEERQAALGLIARKFHTDFSPALALALRSAEPVVRVQAAAVVARVRGDLKARIRSLIASSHPRDDSLDLAAAAELLRLSDCEFVDRADGERCRSAAESRLAKALATSDDVRAAAASANPDTANAVENFLLSAGRLKDFRVSRRIHELVVSGKFRVRRAGSSAVT